MYIRTIVSILILSIVLTPAALFANPGVEMVTITATVADPNAPVDSDGSSHGYIVSIKTGVQFSGFAYPRAVISVLKDATLRTTTIADKTGFFTILLDEQFDSEALYTLYADDVTGERSLLLNYPLVVYVGYLTHVSGIRFAPTLKLDKLEVREGDFLTVSGYAQPEKQIQIIFSDEAGTERPYVVMTEKNGFYRLTLSVGGFRRGEYTARVRYVDDIRRVSQVKRFVIGALNVSRDEAANNIPGDCNVDRIIDLTDFSVVAFWYGKKNPPACVDMNRDKKIDLKDFSILAYYWTG